MSNREPITFQELPEILELAVDSYCLGEVLSLLADICIDKTEQLEQGQNLKLAKEWERAYEELIKLINTINL